MHIVALLTEIGLDVQAKIQHLNRGGCGFYAMAMYDELTRRGFNCQIRVLTFEHCGTAPNVEEINSALLESGPRKVYNPQSWWDRGVSFNHICIEVEGYFHDTDGTEEVGRTFGSRRWRPCPGALPRAVLVKLLNKDWAWNPSFDRNQICELRQTVKSLVKKLDTETITL